MLSSLPLILPYYTPFPLKSKLFTALASTHFPFIFTYFRHFLRVSLHFAQNRFVQFVKAV